MSKGSDSPPIGGRFEAYAGLFDNFPSDLVIGVSSRNGHFRTLSTALFFLVCNIGTLQLV